MIRVFFKKIRSLVKISFLKSEKKQGKENGVALLIAISTLAIMMGIVTDLILSTSVSLRMSSSVRDKIQSEYAAKSGLNLGLYLFSLTWGVELVKPQITGQKGKLVDSAESFWEFINALPALGADTVKLQEDFKDVLSEDTLGLRGVMNEENREIMSLFEDSFKIKIKDENGKINVNDCAKGRCKNTLENLIALFSGPAEKDFLSDKNLTPKELAYRIKDFISETTKTSPESGVGDKNTYYQGQAPSYKTKGLPFDSLSELKLIHGFDDEVFAVFSPYLTVYPFNNSDKNEFSKININTASEDLLANLVPSALSDGCRKTFLKKMKKLKKDDQAISGDNISATLKDLMCYAPGIDEDKPKSDPASWFSTHSSAFRLTIEGRKNNKKTILTVILKRLNPGERTPGSDKLKLKRSYQILYWHFS